jgi:rhamnose utilization protein RhaD (predicted bifunctional aldolase and dehydrogenase)
MMSNLTSTTEEQVKAFCARIGADPLLVQGAGGNVSWKDGDVLWVKASGTWLADAKATDIFVPVDLSHLRQVIANQDFGSKPNIVGDSKLRPSIETMLHALLPHKVVVHLHAVEILAYLVRANPVVDFHRLIGDAVEWVFVDYFKPGAELAQAVSAHIAGHPDVDVIFLRNHGVVVGAESIAGIKQIIDGLTLTFGSDVGEHFPKQEESLMPKQVDGYVYSQHDDLHQLARNIEYFDYLQTKWALYPDQIVFLGPSPYVYKSHNEFMRVRDKFNELPEVIFIYGEGVYVLPDFSKAKAAQLLCYYEVLRRQKSMSQLRSLSDSQVFELTDWEAEKYRKQLAD